MKTLKIVWIVACCSIIGCSSPKPGEVPDIGNKIAPSVRKILEGAERLEIMSLHPSPYDVEGKPASAAEDFHDYKILARAEVSRPSDRDEIIATVYRGILDSEGIAAACFNPRHGIRASIGEQSVDLVICYECLSMHLYDAKGGRSSALTTESPGDALTAIWNRNGLQIHAGE